VPLVRRILEDADTHGRPHVAVSDWMRATPFQISDWIPGPYAVLGTDGFGRADTREALRRYHRIDASTRPLTASWRRLVKLGELDE
jgi:pyruvate dehydrogenase E1 component